eukprot:g26500.t1
MQSLHTSIPHQDGLRALHLFLENQLELLASTTTFLHLAELIPTLHNFSFNSSCFVKAKGVAVRTSMGLSYACLFVGLATNICYKPTNSYSYLDYMSSHPSSCKHSIPFSQFLCLRLICSDAGKSTIFAAYNVVSSALGKKSIDQVIASQNIYVLCTKKTWSFQFLPAQDITVFPCSQ